jgi:dephospho-CoA kinase
MRLIKVGLTGGIAAGKSTVAARWRRVGAAVIDTDELAHEALTPATPTYAAIVKTFGKQVLNADMTISRKALGEIVFADEQKRLALNRIVHPAVAEMWHQSLAELERGGQAEVAIAMIPLLYEVGVEGEFDCVVAVACSEQTQFARLAAKGLSESQASARIRAQWPLQKKMDRADYVIWNDGSREVLDQQADVVWATIKESHHAPSKN